jgi:kynurenine formamidase
MSDHSGTHVDAPAHFIPGGKTIEQTAPNIYVGPAKVVDFSGDDGDEGELKLQVFKDKLTDKALEIEAGDCVLFKFQSENGKVFSGLSEEVSSFLSEQKVKLVGTDQPSIDWSENKTRPAHRVLLSAEIPIVEMLTNLELIKGGKATFMGLPLKMTGATGSPIRAIAIENS